VGCDSKGGHLFDAIGDTLVRFPRLARGSGVVVFGVSGRVASHGGDFLLCVSNNDSNVKTTTTKQQQQQQQQRHHRVLYVTPASFMPLVLPPFLSGWIMPILVLFRGCLQSASFVAGLLPRSSTNLCNGSDCGRCRCMTRRWSTTRQSERGKRDIDKEHSKLLFVRSCVFSAFWAGRWE